MENSKKENSLKDKTALERGEDRYNMTLGALVGAPNSIFA